MANCRKDQFVRHVLRFISLLVVESLLRPEVFLYRIQFYPSRNLKRMANCRKDQLSAEACACRGSLHMYRIQFYPSRNLKRMANCRKDQLSAETFVCRGSLHCIVFSFILQGILREWRTVGKISCQLRHLLVEEVYPVSYSVLSFKES